MEEGFNEISIALLRNQLDFDYLFEAALPKATLNGKYLSVGEGKFLTVVIPFVDSLSPEIHEKLLTFIRNGGQVMALMPLEALEGIESFASVPKLVEGLESNRTVKIEHPDDPQPDILYHQRSGKDQETYFILNSGTKTI